MRMRMKSRSLYVPIVMAVMSALAVTATTWTTTGTPGQSLNGKMFTLSSNGRGISLYAPYYYPSSSTSPYYSTTTPPTTYPWTTAPTTRGVSVCLRYLAENFYLLFTLSPSSRTPLQFGVNGAASYMLTYGYYQQSFQPNIRFWTNIGPDIWNSVCFTVDSMKNVAQVFSGSNISIRKILPRQYDWSGEPVMECSGFDGQLTDVQIWDYALSYREVFNYMTSGVYAPYRGSALSWSDISYSLRGQSLLEDTFEVQGRQPIRSSRGRKGCRPKGGKKTRKFYNVERSKSEQL
ncbi:uncharacterized protein [Cebidichthys violaceus]|uniref:uncharacterized protein n=1 Tax=Cebidichthys violaceus TaxID=271503 RepID=UPI0035CA9A7F